jgi:hypothetical protein
MLRYPLFVACALLFGCAKTVDLGQEGAWRDTPLAGADPAKPQTLYEGSVRVIAFTVDETDLYALLESTAAGDRQVSLVACPADHCQSQRRTLFSMSDTGDSLLSSTALLLRKGKLYWLTGRGDPASGVVSCPTLGCPEGPEVLFEGGFITSLVSDGDYVYWLDTIQRSLVRRAADGAGIVESLYQWTSDSSIPARLACRVRGLPLFEQQ